MLKLHGFPVSNYTNMVQLALLEKGVPFEYVLTVPAQSGTVLAKSPRRLMHRVLPWRSVRRPRGTAH